MGKDLVQSFAQEHPKLLECCQTLTADAAYDDTKLIERLWEQHHIKQVIDIRNMWKNGEITRVVGEHTNVVHNYRGEVFCHCPQTGEVRAMAYGGFEEKRGTLKYRCPACQYETKCAGKPLCPVAG